MVKVLVLYYSSYGHIEQMAEAMAEGARKGGATVDIKRVPETVPEATAKAAHFKLDQKAPIAKVEELPNYDAIIVGVGTRYGRMASQMAAFLDQTGALWAKGALTGKIGAAFTSTATQHGGQEMTLFSIITNLITIQINFHNTLIFSYSLCNEFSCVITKQITTQVNFSYNFILFKCFGKVIRSNVINVIIT